MIAGRRVGPRPGSTALPVLAAKTSAVRPAALLRRKALAFDRSRLFGHERCFDHRGWHPIATNVDTYRVPNRNCRG